MTDKQKAQAFLRNFLAIDISCSKMTRDLQIQESCQSPELVLYQSRHLLWSLSLISKPSLFHHRVRFPCCIQQDWIFPEKLSEQVTQKLINHHHMQETLGHIQTQAGSLCKSCSMCRQLHSSQGFSEGTLLSSFRVAA